MCMHTKCIINQYLGRPYIMAGYECGDIILWDVTEHKPICQSKCFDEPGKHSLEMWTCKL